MVAPRPPGPRRLHPRSEEHTSELQSQSNLVCRLLLEKKKSYLTLRRAVRAAPLAHASGVIHVAEPGRAIGRRDVAGVLDRPVLAEGPARAPIRRAVEAGLLSTRLPDVLARPAHEALGRLGLLGDRRGQG